MDSQQQWARALQSARQHAERHTDKRQGQDEEKTRLIRRIDLYKTELRALLKQDARDERQVIRLVERLITLRAEQLAILLHATQETGEALTEEIMAPYVEKYYRDCDQLMRFVDARL